MNASIPTGKDQNNPPSNTHGRERFFSYTFRRGSTQVFAISAICFYFILQEIRIERIASSFGPHLDVSTLIQEQKTAIAHTPSGKIRARYEAIDPNPNLSGPRVAWLMSFPNSGTSYTGSLIKAVSNRTTATNYGKEGLFSDEVGSIPLRSDSPSGPYKSKSSNDMPTTYVQTKTHCGGRCGMCSPSKYIETLDSFEEMCRSGHYITRKKKQEDMIYSTGLVQRATHLIRNPFNNLVSRYHLKLNQNSKDLEWVSKHPNSPEGFRAHCKEMDTIYARKEEQSRLLSNDIRTLFKGVPCHAEVFKYVQWHNLALATTKRLRLPTHILHYESYETDFNATLQKLLEFLDLEQVGEAPTFIKGKDYLHYYTINQRRAAMKLIQRVATPETWELLKHYNVE